ncbi:MAG: CoxG family protein [Roseovarius sp.]|uniref:CoxG family protein n=1 Tax=Roseovarius sp. TaxID=1486281 RepID=UPI004058E15E
MKMSDSREIAADRATVWAALLSPEALKECVPGAQEVTGTPEDGFEAVVVQKVGPVKATFKGSVTLSDMVEPESLTLSGAGKGGTAGHAKGSAAVRLEEIEGGTRLHYDVEASVGGKLAQLGSRIVDGFAKKMADQFFARLETAVVPPMEAPAKAPEEDTAEADGEAPKKGWFRRMLG